MMGPSSSPCLTLFIASLSIIYTIATPTDVSHKSTHEAPAQLSDTLHSISRQHRSKNSAFVSRRSDFDTHRVNYNTNFNHNRDQMPISSYNPVSASGESHVDLHSDSWVLRHETPSPALYTVKISKPFPRLKSDYAGISPPSSTANPESFKSIDLTHFADYPHSPNLSKSNTKLKLSSQNKVEFSVTSNIGVPETAPVSPRSSDKIGGLPSETRPKRSLRSSLTLLSTLEDGIGRDYPDVDIGNDNGPAQYEMAQEASEDSSHERLRDWLREMRITKSGNSKLLNLLPSSVYMVTPVHVGYRPLPRIQNFGMEEDQENMDNDVDANYGLGLGRLRHILLQPPQISFEFDDDGEDSSYPTDSLEKRDGQSDDVVEAYRHRMRNTFRRPVMQRPRNHRTNYRNLIDEIERRQHTRGPLRLYMAADEPVCEPEKDGTKPMTCPSDDSVCLYDDMICDGTKTCPGGEDETFALCVLRHWAFRWLRHFHTMFAPNP